MFYKKNGAAKKTAPFLLSKNFNYSSRKTPRTSVVSVGCMSSACEA